MYKIRMTCVGVGSGREIVIRCVPMLILRPGKESKCCGIEEVFFCLLHSKLWTEMVQLKGGG